MRKSKNHKLPLVSAKWLYESFLFICRKNSRFRTEHCTKKDWPLRGDLVPGRKNVMNDSLVSKGYIILPVLYKKLKANKTICRSS